jgi:hypothetical protein
MERRGTYLETMRLLQAVLVTPLSKSGEAAAVLAFGEGQWGVNSALELTPGNAGLRDALPGDILPPCNRTYGALALTLRGELVLSDCGIESHCSPSSRCLRYEKTIVVTDICRKVSLGVPPSASQLAGTFSPDKGASTCRILVGQGVSMMDLGLSTCDGVLTRRLGVFVGDNCDDPRLEIMELATSATYVLGAVTDTTVILTLGAPTIKITPVAKEHLYLVRSLCDELSEDPVVGASLSITSSICADLLQQDPTLSLEPACGDLTATLVGGTLVLRTECRGAPLNSVSWVQEQRCPDADVGIKGGLAVSISALEGTYPAGACETVSAMLSIELTEQNICGGLGTTVRTYFESDNCARGTELFDTHEMEQWMEEGREANYTKTKRTLENFYVRPLSREGRDTLKNWTGGCSPTQDRETFRIDVAENVLSTGSCAALCPSDCRVAYGALYEARGLYITVKATAEEGCEERYLVEALRPVVMHT